MAIIDLETGSMEPMPCKRETSARRVVEPIQKQQIKSIGAE